MRIEYILLWLFVISVFGGLFFAACNLIGAAVYEFLAIRRNRLLRARRVRVNTPLLSVIIPAHNEAMVIERCLHSLAKSTYNRFEIIVVDDKSTDRTRLIVETYMRKHPQQAIRLVAKARNGGRGTAIDAGLRYARGSLVMTLDADCVVEPTALANMVRCFNDERIAAVAANIRIIPNQTLISLLQQFDYLVGFRSKKFNTIAGCEYIVGGAGATYRRTVLDQVKGFDYRMKTEDIEMSLRIVRQLDKRMQKLAYASNVIIYTEPAPTYASLFRQRFRWKFGSLQALYKHRSLFLSLRAQHSKVLTVLRLPFVLWSEFGLLLEPFYFSYFLYQAAANRNVTLFVGANIVMTLLLLMAIWSDEHLRLRERLHLSAYAPMMYLAFFVMTAIQVLSAIKSVANLRSVTGKKQVVGAYISPERIGQQFDSAQ